MLQLRRKSKEHMHHDYQANIQQYYEPPKKKIAIKLPVCGNLFDRIEEKGWLVWFLLKTWSPNLSSRVPTWTAYDSLIGNLRPLTCAAMLLVINESPTEWRNLCTAIKETEKLKAKTVRVEWWENSHFVWSAVIYQSNTSTTKPDIRDNFVFRMEELHVVLCALKVLEKLIDRSGLDQAFVEAGS